MSKNIWDDDETEDFRDIPDEVQYDENGHLGVAPPPTLPRQQRQAGPQKPDSRATMQVYQEESADVFENNEDDSEEEDYASVLSDARIRLEMGRLYDMVMNHELFDGVESDARAIKSVQKQIRRFAKEQMEVMLGMRKTAAAVSDLGMPFNGLEVEVLKKIAATFSQGATETEEAEQVPVIVKPVKKQVLNSIGLSKPSAPKPIIKPQARAQSAPLPSKAQAPIERQAKSAETVNDLEPNYKPLKKAPQEMTTDELLRRNQEAMERQKNRKPSTKPSNILPQPTVEQEEMLYTQRLVTDAKTSGTVATIMNLMKNQRKQ